MISPEMFGKEHPAFELGSVTHPEIKDNGANSTEYFDNLLERTRGQKLPPAELGVKMGKAFLSVHQENILDNPRALISMHNKLEKALGSPEKAKQLMSGWLGEFAVAYALYNLGLDQEVWFPTDEEDLRSGVDWWVSVEGVHIPIQVKILPFTQQGAEAVLQQVIYKLPNDERALMDLANHITGYQMLGNKSMETDERGRSYASKVLGSIKRCAALAAEDESIKPALIALPSTFGDLSVINTDSGTFLESDYVQHNAEQLEQVLTEQIQSQFLTTNMELSA